MGVTIHWRPISEKSKSFSGGTSTSLEHLKHVFGNRIAEEDLPILRGMSVASNDKFYEEVAEIIERFGEIEVWGEY